MKFLTYFVPLNIFLNIENLKILTKQSEKLYKNKLLKLFELKQLNGVVMF